MIQIKKRKTYWEYRAIEASHVAFYVPSITWVVVNYMSNKMLKNFNNPKNNSGHMFVKLGLK